MSNKDSHTSTTVSTNISLPEKKLLIPKTEEERLRDDIFRPDMEKFLLFTRMLKRNAMFKKAKITHK